MNVVTYHRRGFTRIIGGLILAGLMLVLSASVLAAGTAGAKLYVTPTGTGSICTRALPCGLQTALARAVEGDTIYMAAGQYTGTGAAVVTIASSITLYGGWDGAPGGVLVRDPEAYPTILDGEDARRVIYISGSIAPVLDGFIIQHGNATGLGGYSTSDAGGAVYIDTANAQISRCIIRWSHAGPASNEGNGEGGGLFITQSNTILQNSLIISNTARWGGGARVISAAPQFSGIGVLYNEAQYGGGMYLMWTTGRVEDSRFEGNYGSMTGGALYLSGADAIIAGNVIRGNDSKTGAGIGVNTGASVAIWSNLIVGNSATVRGGGLYIDQNDGDVRNNVIADNEAPTGAGVYAIRGAPELRHNTIARNGGMAGHGLYVAEDAAPSLVNTIIAGHTVGVEVSEGSSAALQGTLWGSDGWANTVDWGGDGSVTSSQPSIWGLPGFIDPDSGDYHISVSSAAVDAGVDAGVTEDIDGDSRPQGSGFDIGADEFLSGVPTATPTSTATPTRRPTSTPTVTPTRLPVTIAPRQYLPLMMRRRWGS